MRSGTGMMVGLFGGAARSAKLTVSENTGELGGATGANETVPVLINQ